MQIGQYLYHQVYDSNTKIFKYIAYLCRYAGTHTQPTQQQ